jgi:glyoxylase-like metal-dependent hydrolase (beta-lactamase superfamily II)
MGGATRLTAVRTLVLEGSGKTYSFGQSVVPGGELPVVDILAVRRSIDAAGGRWRQRQTQARRPPSPNTVPVTYSFGVDGQVAYTIDDDGSVSRDPAAVARERRTELRHHPLGLLVAALGPGASVSDARTTGDRERVDVAIADGTFTLAIDTRTKLPVSVTSLTYDPVFGDVPIETSFGSYEDVAGVKLPTRLSTRRDRDVVASLEVRNVIDAELPEVAAPAGVPPASAPTVHVTTEPIADGVWLLGGQSHHSVLVELADRLILVEAPQDAERTRAVIAAARALVPSKPLTHAIMSHHHDDHAGGIRTAVAEGLTIVAHESAKSFVEDLAARKHALVNDALALHPAPLKLELVGAERMYGGGARTVEVYPVTDNLHAASMLMVYVRHARILITADLFDRSSTGKFPFAANLIGNVEHHKLVVDQLVGLHGRPVPFSDVIAAAPKS